MTFNRIKTFEIRAFKDTHLLGWFYLEATEDPKKKFKMRTDPAGLWEQWAYVRLLYAKENIDDLEDRIAQAEIGLKTHKRISLGEFQATMLQMHEAGFTSTNRRNDPCVVATIDAPTISAMRRQCMPASLRLEPVAP